MLRHIRGNDERVEVMLELMRCTCIPWSEQVEKLIQSFLSSGRKRTEELREQYRLMQINKMLLKYGVSDFNVSDVSMAKGNAYWYLVSIVLGNMY